MLPPTQLLPDFLGYSLSYSLTTETKKNRVRGSSRPRPVYAEASRRQAIPCTSAGTNRPNSLHDEEITPLGLRPVIMLLKWLFQSDGLTLSLTAMRYNLPLVLFLIDTTLS